MDGDPRFTSQPSVLVQRPLEVWPTDTMTHDERLNATVRLTVVVAIVSFVASLVAPRGYKGRSAIMGAIITSGVAVLAFVAVELTPPPAGQAAAAVAAERTTPYDSLLDSYHAGRGGGGGGGRAVASVRTDDNRDGDCRVMDNPRSNPLGNAYPGNTRPCRPVAAYNPEGPIMARAFPITGGIATDNRPFIRMPRLVESANRRVDIARAEVQKRPARVFNWSSEE